MIDIEKVRAWRRKHWATCYHEAGHAVACVALDIAMDHVFCDGPESGYCESYGLNLDAIWGRSPSVVRRLRVQYRSESEAYITMCMAGAIAGRRHDLAELAVEHDTDGAIIEQHLSFLNPRGADDVELCRRLYRDADALIRANWLCVIAVAARLKVRRRMTRLEVIAAMAYALGHRGSI